MAIDIEMPRSRRALLLASIGGAAAVVAQAVGRPLPVRAAGSDGTPIVVAGQYLDARSETKIVNTSPYNGGNPSTRAMWLQASGLALLAKGGYGGVDGQGSSTGVSGWGQDVSGVGVIGVGGDSAPFENALNAPVGVYGRTSTDIAGYGVRGRSELGVGVRGESVSNTAMQGASTSGIGVHGTSGAGTGVRGLSTSAAGVYGSSGPGTGVRGVSTSGTGVKGESTSGIGVEAKSNSAVALSAGTFDSPAIEAFNYSTDRGTVEASNFSGGVAVMGLIDFPSGTPPLKTAVYGEAMLDDECRGVSGRSTSGKGVMGIASSGRGIHGQAGSGVGVYATATSSTGTALQVVGKAVFNRSGAVTFSTGQSFRDISVSGITSSSLVFVTIATNRAGLAVQSAVPTTGAFRINLNKPVTGATKVAWFVLG